MKGREETFRELKETVGAWFLAKVEGRTELKLSKEDDYNLGEKFTFIGIVGKETGGGLSERKTSSGTWLLNRYFSI